MKVIYKYKITITDEQILQLPDDYEILCAQVQRNDVCLWVKHNKSKFHPKCNCRILMYGTGHHMTHGEGKYIGTVQLESGSLVFHIFEDN